jgi:aryl-alcohol dehydrogenase-like predicted oxidoreductase
MLSAQCRCETWREEIAPTFTLARRDQRVWGTEYIRKRPTSMNYRKLGQTGLLVSELCLGTQTFGGKGHWRTFGAQDQTEATRLVAQALDAGVNFFDTAEAYSDGQAETLLGTALGVRRDDVVVATKASGRFGAGLNTVGLSRKRLVSALDASLSRLGTDYVDLYQLHSPDPLTPLEETLGTLDDLVRTGKVRYVGCSNYPAWEVMKALGISERGGLTRFASVQAYYSLAGRDLERETVSLLQDQELALLVWSPLAGGFLTEKFAGGEGPPNARRSKLDFPPIDRAQTVRCLTAIREIAEEHGATVARVALAWLLHQEAVTSVLVGATSEEQLADNLKAGEVSLVRDDLERLDEVSALTPGYPGWMLDLAARDAFTLGCARGQHRAQ